MAYIKINTNSGNTGLVTIVLSTEKKLFTFLIDTGSNVSHIDKSAISLLQNYTKVSINNSSTVGINGTLDSNEKVQLLLNSGVFTFSHQYLVTDLSTMIKSIEDNSNLKIHGILGTDFLSKYMCHLDFKKSRLHLG